MELINTAAIGDIRRGYVSDGEDCVCLFCGERLVGGFIYEIGGKLMDARRAMEAHIKARHGTVFETLLAGGKKLTGLTDNQAELLKLLYRGQSDEATAAATHTSPSTVRFQRHSFRERAKQARVLIALAELFEENRKSTARESVTIHKGARMVDERYMTTEAEAEKIAGNFFTSRDPMKLKILSSKEKNKLVILRIIAQKFERGRRYSEREINDTLEAIYEDYATLRRYLIEYGFMERTKDCSEYWLRDTEV